MKGQRFLLEAIAKLRTEFPELRLVLIGRLKEGSHAQRTIEELGLWDIVEFVSGVPDARIVELYNESACAVVPSLYEGFSLPAIEAMSTGCPLVATTGGALGRGDRCRRRHLLLGRSRETAKPWRGHPSGPH